MGERYVATFDSLRPQRGIVVDEQASRYATFVTVAQAEGAAQRLNAQELDLDLPQLAPLLTWRSTVSGELVSSSDISGSDRG